MGINYKCPQCSEEMQRGKSMVHGTPLGCLVIGLSHQHLWFDPDPIKNDNSTFIDKAVKHIRGDPEVEKKVVISSGGSKTSFQCVKCGLVLIQNH